VNFNVNFNVINRASVGEIKRNFGNIKIRGKTMQKKKQGVSVVSLIW